MTAIANRFLVLLLVCGAAPCASAGAQTRADPNPQETVSRAAPDQLVIDIARLRRLLGEPRPPGSKGGLTVLASILAVESTPQPITIDENGVLRFEERVDVRAIRLRSLAEEFKDYEKESSFPYSYAPSLQELSLRIPALQYVHPVNAVMALSKAIGGAMYRAKVEKARREVEAELEALKAHNAALAATASNPPKKQP